MGSIKNFHFAKNVLKLNADNSQRTNSCIFGSMPWCSFPWHKLLLGLTQKNCYTVYSHLQSKFVPWVASLFWNTLIYAGLRRKAFPRKQAKVDISVFSGCPSNSQDSLKASQGGSCKMAQRRAEDILAQARASTRGTAPLKNNYAFRRPANERTW